MSSQFNPLGRPGHGSPISLGDMRRAYEQIERSANIGGEGVQQDASGYHIRPSESELVLAVIRARSENTPYQYAWTRAMASPTSKAKQLDDSTYEGTTANNSAVDLGDPNGLRPLNDGDVVWLKYDFSGGKWCIVGRLGDQGEQVVKVIAGAANSFGYPAYVQSWSKSTGEWSDLNTTEVRIEDPNSTIFSKGEYLVGKFLGKNSSDVDCYVATPGQVTAETLDVSGYNFLTMQDPNGTWGATVYGDVTKVHFEEMGIFKAGENSNDGTSFWGIPYGTPVIIPRAAGPDWGGVLLVPPETGSTGEIPESRWRGFQWVTGHKVFGGKRSEFHGSATGVTACDYLQISGGYNIPSGEGMYPPTDGQVMNGLGTSIRLQQIVIPIGPVNGSQEIINSAGTYIWKATSGSYDKQLLEVSPLNGAATVGSGNPYGKTNFTWGGPAFSYRNDTIGRWWVKANHIFYAAPGVSGGSTHMDVNGSLFVGNVWESIIPNVSNSYLTAGPQQRYVDGTGRPITRLYHPGDGLYPGGAIGFQAYDPPAFYTPPDIPGGGNPQYSPKGTRGTLVAPYSEILGTVATVFGTGLDEYLRGDAFLNGGGPGIIRMGHSLSHFSPIMSFDATRVFVRGFAYQDDTTANNDKLQGGTGRTVMAPAPPDLNGNPAPPGSPEVPIFINGWFVGARQTNEPGNYGGFAPYLPFDLGGGGTGIGPPVGNLSPGNGGLGQSNNGTAGSFLVGKGSAYEESTRIKERSSRVETLVDTSVWSRTTSTSI